MASVSHSWSKIYVTIVQYTKTPIYTRKIFLNNRGNYQAFKEDLQSTDWNSLKHDNVDTYASNFIDKVLGFTNKRVPNKMIKIMHSDPLWFNNNIKRLLRKNK